MRIQFNSKSMKQFRTTCQRYYNARHELNDNYLRYKANIKSYQVIIDNDNDTIDRILDGGVSMKKIEDYEFDIENMEKRISEEKESRDTLKKEIDTIIDDCLKIYTDEMYSAMQSVVANWGDDDSINAWRSAVLAMFNANGAKDMKLAPYDVREYDFLVSQKSNTAVKTASSERLLGTKTRKASAKEFMDGLVDYMVAHNYIVPYTYKNNKKSGGVK